MVKFLVTIGILSLLAIMAWKSQQEEIRYVALGDSYTIGEGVNPSQAWPAVLAADLTIHGVKTKLVANLGQTGWTTQDVINKVLPAFDRENANFATLLIGVNDFNRGYGLAKFQGNLKIILDHLAAKLPKNQLVLITIPDFSVTPIGATFGNPSGNSAGIAAFNEIITAEAGKRNIPVVDIFPLSQQMASDSSLVAKDLLHPSAKEYILWEQMIFPVVYGLLKR